VARRLAKAHRDVLAGISLGTIVKQWNAEGFRTAKGKEWSHTVLRDALMRARNGGLVEAHGKIVGKSAWPAIVSEDVWRAVHDKLADGSRTHRNQSNRVKYLLGGIAVCGKPIGVSIVEDPELGPTEVERICGTPLHASPVGGHPRRVYRCDIAERRGHVAVSVSALDAFVTEKLLEQLRWPAFWERYSEATTTSAQAAADLREQESALETRIKQSLSAFANDPNISPTELSGILEDLKAKLADVRARLAEAEAKAHRVMLDPADVERQWKALTLERKRILIRDALNRIVVLPTEQRGPKFDISRVLFDWKIAAIPAPDEYVPREHVTP
jgi:site-specific DNA recombinase